jgi:uncharacterized protein YjiS (DUF1127 family)
MSGSLIQTYCSRAKPSFRSAADGQPNKTQTNSPPKQKRNKKMISLKTVSEKLNAWRYRAAVRELSQLSDHDLSDIGIGRGDIEYVSRSPVMSKASA